MFRYILFDLDGTLTDPKEGITKCVTYALSQFGIEEDPNNLTHFIGPPLIESFEKYYNFNHIQAEEAVEFYRERFDKVGKFENRVLSGVPQMLKKLKEKDKVLAISSSKPEVFVKQILEKYEIDKYFEEVVGSTMDSSKAQKADIIAETFDRLDIRDDEKDGVIMVGDRLHDIVGAHKCGIKCIGVRFGYAKEGELEEYKADYICDTVKDLEEMLLKKNPD